MNISNQNLLRQTDQPIININVNFNNQNQLAQYQLQTTLDTENPEKEMERQAQLLQIHRKLDKLDIILNIVSDLSTRVQNLEKDVIDIKKDILDIKKDIVDIKKDQQETRTDVNQIKQRLVPIQKQLMLNSKFRLDQLINSVNIIDADPTNYFDREQFIGEGAFYKVYKGTSNVDKKQLYAIKIRKTRDNQNTLYKVKKQLYFMQKVQCKNIVRLIHKFFYQSKFYIVVEFMNCGSLTNFIKRFEGKIFINVIRYISYQVLNGLLKIHEKNIIHRDIKSDNILVNSQGQIKISDFCSSFESTKDQIKSIDFAGTVLWMAPQILLKNTYDEKVDIWSFGIFLLQLINGKPPFIGQNQQQAMWKIIRNSPPIFNHQDKDLRNFGSLCLNKTPQQRPAVKLLLQHNFLSDFQQINIGRRLLKVMINGQ